MCVALGIQHKMPMRHIVIFGLPGSTIFFHVISLTFNPPVLNNSRNIEGIFMKYYIGFHKLKRQIEIPVKIEYIWKHFEKRKKDVPALFLAKFVEQLS